MIAQVNGIDPNSQANPGWLWGIIVGIVGLAWFASGVPGEQAFVDEWAYISQSYYADLYLSGDWDDRRWLDYQAYDLPPLPKYTIGVALMAQGFARPKRQAAFQWYDNTSTVAGPRGMLVAARWPSALFGAFGCMMVFSLGRLAFGSPVGLAAAVLLALNPLYALHSRRAMSDIPAESFILATEALALMLIVRLGQPNLRWWIGWGLVGVLGGLATLSKLNGSLGLMTLVAWAVAGLIVLPVNSRRKGFLLIATLLAGGAGLFTFVAGNPFMTASPPGRLTVEEARLSGKNLWQRAEVVAEHRAGVSRLGMKSFPHNALTTPAAKITAVAIQGLGRFGPLGPAHSDSTKRFDWVQDWGAAPWAVCLAIGGLFLGRRIPVERSAGRTPVALLIGIQGMLAVVVVTAFIPLAWDRYFLSIQPFAALIGALGLCDLVRLLWPKRPDAGQTR